jgi:hypothetical protein
MAAALLRSADLHSQEPQADTQSRMLLLGNGKDQSGSLDHFREGALLSKSSKGRIAGTHNMTETAETLPSR